MKDFKSILLDEASGSYPGAILVPKTVGDAYGLGAEIGRMNLKAPYHYGKGVSGIFVKSVDMKKINKYLLKNMKKVHGAYDFSVDEFIPSGVRGVVEAEESNPLNDTKFVQAILDALEGAPPDHIKAVFNALIAKNDKKAAKLLAKTDSLKK